jgi:DNA-binding response OmpR family regulator
VVLLAEDELEVRQRVTEALQAQGLTVLHASDGVEALIISRNCTEKIDLMVVDLEIGGQVGGIQLAEHVRREKPCVAVLILCRDGEAQCVAAEKGFASLIKPFTIPALIRTVGDALTAGALEHGDSLTPAAPTASRPAQDERRQLERDLLDRVQRAAQVYRGAVDAQAFLDLTQGGVGIPAGTHLAPLTPAPEQAAHLALDHYRRALKTFSDLVMHGRQPSCHELLESVLDAAIQATRAARGTIHIADPLDGALTLAAQRGFGQPFLDFFQHLPADAPVCGHALRTGRRIAVADVFESPLFRGTPALAILMDSGVRATQATPLFANEGVVGVLSTYYPAPVLPGRQDLERIDDFAAQAASLIVGTTRE